MKFWFPLIEWGITEASALSFCYEHGYRWQGLYEHFDRVSCFCCPLQGLSELRTLRREFPRLWQKMLDMGSRLSGKRRRFKNEATVVDLDRRFAAEDCQLPLFKEEKK